MVRDFKGNWGKSDKKAESPGWLILVISHLAIFIVGLSLGHWMGERFAKISAPQDTLSRPVESEKGTPSVSEKYGGKKPVPEAPKDDEIERRPRTEPDPSENEPRFTFYESLQKEKLSGSEPPIKEGEGRGTTASRGIGFPPPRIKTEPSRPTQQSTFRVYYVQVASFQKEAMAQRLAERLRGRGYPAEVVPKVIINRGVWYRVRMGPFGSESEATERAAAIEKSENLRPFVWSEKGKGNS